MSEATFRDICVDAAEPGTLATFWARALHLELHDTADGNRMLTPPGGERGHGLTWVLPVPEPRTGKTRVHLDVRLPEADPAPLLALGATVVREPGDGVHWWVLADPEGNDFCAFPPAPPEWNAAVDIPTPFELVVDCSDPDAIAGWWAARFGVQVQSREGKAERWLEGVPSFPYRFWVFAPVPEPRTAKNRWHWDVDLTNGSYEAFLDAGATLLRAPDDEIRWAVLADPEGNEFCVFPPTG